MIEFKSYAFHTTQQWTVTMSTMFCFATIVVHNNDSAQSSKIKMPLLCFAGGIDKANKPHITNLRPGGLAARYSFNFYCYVDSFCISICAHCSIIQIGINMENHSWESLIIFYGFLPCQSHFYSCSNMSGLIWIVFSSLISSGKQ